MMVHASETGRAGWIRMSGLGAEWLCNGAELWYDSEAVTPERRHTGERRTVALAERWARTLRVLPYMAIRCEAKTVGTVRISGFSS